MILKLLISNPSFKVTFWFRIGSYLRGKRNFVYKILYFFVYSLHKHNQYKTGIQLFLGTQIGGGLLFPHFSCIVIGANAIIGKNCTIFQGVTIGSNTKGIATIKDNVVLCAGAKIIGSVAIYDNVIIGANAVVTKEIPTNAVVAGVPAEIISYNGKLISDYYVNHFS